MNKSIQKYTRKSVSREKIIECLKEYEKISYIPTVTDIAKKTGLTRRTIYKHLPSITEELNEASKFELQMAMKQRVDLIIRTIETMVDIGDITRKPQYHKFAIDIMLNILGIGPKYTQINVDSKELNQNQIIINETNKE